MDWQKIISNLEKIVPIAIFAGLFADWFRLRLARRVEERQHIARAISELLELRHIVRGLQELPKHIQKMLPPEFADRIPKEIWHSIDILKMFPMDDALPKRYKKTVEEIAGFNPFLAFKLRGKERYFDLRNVISQRLSQSPGSPIIASQITNVLDRDYMPVIKEMLHLLAKAHSMRMRFSVYFALRQKPTEDNLITQESLEVFQERFRQMLAAASSKTTQAPIAKKLA